MNPIRSLAALAALALVALAPATASAQETLTACYVPKSGTVYRIQVAGAPTKCAQNHAQFSWETGGTGSSVGFVQGEAMSVQVDAGNVWQQHVKCPANAMAVSGGYYGPHDMVVYVSTRAYYDTWEFWVMNNGAAPQWVAFEVYCLAVN